MHYANDVPNQHFLAILRGEEPGVDGEVLYEDVAIKDAAELLLLLLLLLLLPV